MKNVDLPRLKTSKLVCFGGLLSALALLLQSAPVWFVAGLALSPLTTAPIAIAAFLSPLCGIAAFLCTSALLLLISTQEALIFILGTGLLGLILGLMFRAGSALSIFIAGAALFCGLDMLTIVCGINLFGPLTQYISRFLQVFFALFSVAYASLWRIILKLMLSRLKGVNT